MNTLVRNWWAIALRGAVAILFGLLLLFLPGISLGFLILLFGSFAIVDGVFTLISAVRSARAHERWGSLALVGVTGIVVGLFAWMWPAVTAAALAFLIGAWAFITGVLEIVASVKLRKQITGEFWLGLSGALSVLFAILVFANPAAGALAVVWLIGLYAVLFGASLIGLSLRLRSLGHARERRHVTV
ncbi:HdeD family acid-resistance protein [Vulgatibacter sp.]|uniref:HdeD family acid-resistance protein n=1 Tax=Vulgatibacter sp. TaxID=1971226 RepID=UPI0035648875